VPGFSLQGPIRIEATSGYVWPDWPPEEHVVSALVLTRASAAGLATAATGATSATTTTAKTRIRCRFDNQPIQAQIDRVRHDRDGVERGVVECVRRALDKRQCGRHARAIELVEEI